MSSTPEHDSVPTALAEAWRADTPSPNELRRGYARFLRAPRRRSVAPRLVASLAAGLVLGLGLAQAATLAHKGWWGTRDAAVSAPSPRPPNATHEVSEPAPAPSASSTSSIEVAPVVETAPRRVVAPRPNRAAEAGPQYIQAQWQSVTDALRRKDWVTAEAALLEIERSTAGAERDAAQLSRAQLLARSGRSSAALPLATELHARARSSVVREQAGELAARLAPDSLDQRSTQPGPATKEP